MLSLVFLFLGAYLHLKKLPQSFEFTAIVKCCSSLDYVPQTQVRLGRLLNRNFPTFERCIFMAQSNNRLTPGMRCLILRLCLAISNLTTIPCMADTCIGLLTLFDHFKTCHLAAPLVLAKKLHYIIDCGDLFVCHAAEKQRVAPLAHRAFSFA